jgi:hypothetical protein
MQAMASIRSKSNAAIRDESWFADRLGCDVFMNAQLMQVVIFEQALNYWVMTRGLSLCWASRIIGHG